MIQDSRDGFCPFWAKTAAAGQDTHTRCLTYTNTNTHALSHSYTVDNASVEKKKLIDLSGKELVEGSDSKV